MNTHFRNAIYQFRFDEKKGRHVVAARPIPAGEAVLRQDPYAAVVKDAYVHAFCIRCFQTAPSLFCCSGCNHARFCSIKCRDAIAGVHNLECAALKRMPECS